MNQKQTIAMWAGIAAIVAMGLFPPSVKPGYTWWYSSIITAGPVLWGKLFVQWFLVAVVTGGLIVTLRDKKTPQVNQES